MERSYPNWGDFDATQAIGMGWASWIMACAGGGTLVVAKVTGQGQKNERWTDQGGGVEYASEVPGDMWAPAWSNEFRVNWSRVVRLGPA